MIRSGSGWLTTIFLLLVIAIGLGVFSYFEIEKRNNQYLTLIMEAAPASQAAKLKLDFGKLNSLTQEYDKILKNRKNKIANIRKLIGQLRQRGVDLKKKIKKQMPSKKQDKSIEEADEEVLDLLPVSEVEESNKKKASKLKKASIKILRALAVFDRSFDNLLLEMYRLGTEHSTGRGSKSLFDSYGRLKERTGKLTALLAPKMRNHEKFITRKVDKLQSELVGYVSILKALVKNHSKYPFEINNLEKKLSDMTKAKEGDQKQIANIQTRLISSFPNYQIYWMGLLAVTGLLFLLLIITRFNIVAKGRAKKLLARKPAASAAPVSSQTAGEKVYLAELIEGTVELYEDCNKAEGVVDQWIQEVGQLSNSPMRLPLQLQKMINKIKLEVKMIIQVGQKAGLGFPSFKSARKKKVRTESEIVASSTPKSTKKKTSPASQEDPVIRINSD